MEEGASPALSRIITLGTLSKALGSQGGWVCGPRVLIDYLVGSARSFVYSTGLNPPAVGAALAALRIIEAEPNRVHQCRANAATLARELTHLGFDVGFYGAPILPVFADDSQSALQMSVRLLEHRLWCPAIRPPTVKRARLRLTANASWDEATLERIGGRICGSLSLPFVSQKVKGSERFPPRLTTQPVLRVPLVETFGAKLGL